jgi:hypothetical protein
MALQDASGCCQPVYDDPFIREAYDVDLLVSRSDFDPMKDVLDSLRYRSTNSDDPLSKRPEAILAFATTTKWLGGRSEALTPQF